jgi:hypothetical protein
MKANKFIIINNKFLSGVVELHKDLIPEGLEKLAYCRWWQMSC